MVRHISIWIQIFLLAILLGGALGASAQTNIDALKGQIGVRKESLTELEAEIRAYESKLGQLSQQKSGLQTTIAVIDTTRAKLQSEIALTAAKARAKEQTIESLSGKIKQKEDEITSGRRALSTAVQMLSSSDDTSLLEVLLQYDKLSDFFADVSGVERAQGEIMHRITLLASLRASLSSDRASAVTDKTALVSLQNTIQDQKAIAEQKRKEQADLLRTTKNQEGNYQKLLAERRARKAQFEREIDAYEEAIRIAVDLSKVPKIGTRVLGWPTTGTTVTQRFGKTSDSGRLYASGTHNGIDIGVPIGTPIFAAEGGTVIGTGDTDATCRWASYGQWVLIRHPNGLASLYGHLSLIKVREGQTVARGEQIAYSGNTGYSTGPHLHFTVFASNAVQVGNLPSKSCPGATFRLPVAPQNGYLDPQAYL